VGDDDVNAENLEMMNMPPLLPLQHAAPPFFTAWSRSATPPPHRPTWRRDPIRIRFPFSSSTAVERGEREREKGAVAVRSMASMAAYLARRATQKKWVHLLYHTTLNFHHHLFYQEISSPNPPLSASLLILISLPAHGWD
jgi:hypothetical protein